MEEENNLKNTKEGQKVNDKQRPVLLKSVYLKDSKENGAQDSVGRKILLENKLMNFTYDKQNKK